VFIFRKTCTCSFMVFLSCIHISSLDGRRLCLILPPSRLLLWMHERNAKKVNVQVFLRMNTWMFEKCRIIIIIIYYAFIKSIQGLSPSGYRNLSIDNAQIFRIIQKYKINMSYQGTCHCHNHSNMIYKYKLRNILLLE
jgi:hypothetical protein